MRYIAEACAEDYADSRGSIPAVMACVDGLDEGLALRHARAMKAVLLASMAWKRALMRPESDVNIKRLAMCQAKLMGSTDRLEAVEKEVRGE